MYDKTKKATRALLGFLGIVLAATLPSSNVSFVHTIVAQGRRDPVSIASYDRPEIADPAERALREIRDKHYERFTFGMPSLDQIGGGEHTDCYAPGVREKLTLEQDTVVIGGVLAARAYLNSSKQHVYTEYQIRVEQVLRNESNLLTSGKEIIVGRWGGSVQFPEGEIREYRVRKLGMPDIGQRYLFFLEDQKEGGDFYIWTAFSLSNVIRAMDELDSKLFPLAAYRGSNELEFISKVRKALRGSQKPRKPKEN